jgi:hypothetical protein
VYAPNSQGGPAADTTIGAVGWSGNGSADPAHAVRSATAS